MWRRTSCKRSARRVGRAVSRESPLSRTLGRGQQQQNCVPATPAGTWRGPRRAGHPARRRRWPHRAPGPRAPTCPSWRPQRLVRPARARGQRPARGPSVVRLLGSRTAWRASRSMRQCERLRSGDGDLPRLTGCCQFGRQGGHAAAQHLGGGAVAALLPAVAPARRAGPHWGPPGRDARRRARRARRGVPAVLVVVVLVIVAPFFRCARALRGRLPLGVPHIAGAVVHVRLRRRASARAPQRARC